MRGLFVIEVVVVAHQKFAGGNQNHFAAAVVHQVRQEQSFKRLLFALAPFDACREVRKAVVRDLNHHGVCREARHL